MVPDRRSWTGSERVFPESADPGQYAVLLGGCDGGHHAAAVRGGVLQHHQAGVEAEGRAHEHRPGRWTVHVAARGPGQHELQRNHHQPHYRLWVLPVYDWSHGDDLFRVPGSDRDTIEHAPEMVATKPTTAKVTNRRELELWPGASLTKRTRQILWSWLE